MTDSDILSSSCHTSFSWHQGFVTEVSCKTTIFCLSYMWIHIPMFLMIVKLQFLTVTSPQLFYGNDREFLLVRVKQIQWKEESSEMDSSDDKISQRTQDAERLFKYSLCKNISTEIYVCLQPKAKNCHFMKPQSHGSVTWNLGRTIQGK